MNAPTIRQLWDTTPQGEAIKDPAYQYLCEFSQKTKLTIRQLDREIPGLWDMTCEQAVDAISKWFKTERAKERIIEIEERQSAELNEGERHSDSLAGDTWGAY